MSATGHRPPWRRTLPCSSSPANAAAMIQVSSHASAYCLRVLSVSPHLRLRRYTSGCCLLTWYSSRRRRCQRVPPDSAICALCQKHKVMCIATSATTNGSKPSHVRGSSFGVTARPAQTNTTSNVVSTSPHLAAASPHAVSLPQPASHQGSAASPHATDHGSISEVVLPPAAVCFHLATLYFDYVHDQLHTLFQKPSFMADMVMNKTPSVIMFAVVALSARSVYTKIVGMPQRVLTSTSGFRPTNSSPA